MYIHVYECKYMYVPGTHTFMTISICMYIVQTRLYRFTTTLHFPSGPISLATPASLSSAQLRSFRAASSLSSAIQYVLGLIWYIPCTYIAYGVYKKKLLASFNNHEEACNML